MKTRAAVLLLPNRPLEIEELEIPPLRAGQVLVKIAYSGVCRSQLMEIQGKRGQDNYLPHLLGHEGSGIVINIGKDVRKVTKGDKVVLTWIKADGAECGGTQYRHDTTLINAGPITTFSEHAVVSENRCVRLSGNIPLDVSALLGCAVLTGSGIVLNTMRPARGSSILIWGAGGIGLSAVMAARLCECGQIIVVDEYEEKLHLAESFGATDFVNARSVDAPKCVREIAGESGVDYAVEAAGRAETIEMAFSAVKKNGGLCVFASHPPFGQRISLDPHDLISGKNIRGSWGGESIPDRDIPRFVKLYEKGKLPLERLITHRYKLENINHALEDLEKGVVGRPIIEME
jgi:S-(hydroxymethyl)glutathione dehydrogenase / alcohol dehydrogenase